MMTYLIRNMKNKSQKIFISANSPGEAVAKSHFDQAEIVTSFDTAYFLKNEAMLQELYLGIKRRHAKKK